MNKFTTLVIVACGAILFLNENVNGEENDINLLSSDGSYAPGSILGWNSVFDKVREYTEPEGLESLQAAQNLLIPIDEALRKRDLKGALKIARKCIHYFDQFIPYVKNKDFQQYLINGNIRMAKFVESVDKQGPTLFVLNHFLTAEFKNLGSILKNLLGRVGHLLGGVLHGVGDLLKG